MGTVTSKENYLLYLIDQIKRTNLLKEDFMKKEFLSLDNNLIIKKLYYASDDGKHLKRESRSIYYSSSKSIEWAIVERLISGPKVKGNYAVIPPNTHIISITTSEGTCYVNLDESFVSKTLNVSDRLIIYSIVNSLVENCGVTSVQFSVAGETDVKFGSDISLAKPFTEDMSLIEQ